MTAAKSSMLSSVLAACALCSIACGSSLPAPSLTRHPNATFEEVPYPPPAALAETVPERPDRSGVVWIDGDWRFRGQTYTWERGGWVVPPPNASYALSSIVYTQDGRVLFAPATWYGPDHTPLDRQRPVVPAATPPNEYTSETQTGR